MTSSTSRAIALAFILGCLGMNASAQAPGPAKTSKPVGSISGRVTFKNKGLASIGIAIRRANQNSRFETLPQATTDQEGNYKISNVDPGTYEVQPNISAYVISDNTRGGGRPVIVMEGENIEEINFSMVKGGVVTGRITDADGRPVIQQQVRLFRAETPESPAMNQPAPPRMNYPVNNTVTDDRGIYRFFGLRAGRYKAATGRSDQSAMPGAIPGRINYKEVFYPDASEQAKATVLEVSEGSETTNIDIVLGRPVATYTATGRIVNEEGEPVPGMRYGVQRMLSPTERSGYVEAASSANNTGDFLIEGLIPGKYSFVMLPSPNNEFRTDGTTFDIIDSNVSGITIRLVKGASISGVVVIDSEDKRATSRLSQLQLMAYVQKPALMGAGMGGASSISQDGSFRIAGLAGGTAMISLNSMRDMNVMKGLTVSRIEREGVVQPRGIEIKDGEQVAGVRVIVTYSNAVLRGTVNIENGPLPSGARIFVGLMKPGEQQGFIRPPTVDDLGRFVAESLAPGTYEVIVSVAGAGLKPHLPVKQQVTLQNGAVTEIAISYNLADIPNP